MRFTEATDASSIEGVGLGAGQDGLPMAGDAQGIAHQDLMPGLMEGSGQRQVIGPGRFHAYVDRAAEGRQPVQTGRDASGRIGEATDLLTMGHVEPAGRDIDPERLDGHGQSPARE